MTEGMKKDDNAGARGNPRRKQSDNPSWSIMTTVKPVAQQVLKLTIDRNGGRE